MYIAYNVETGKLKEVRKNKNPTHNPANVSVKKHMQYSGFLRLAREHLDIPKLPPPSTTVGKKSLGQGML